MIENTSFSRKFFLKFNTFICILIGIICIAPVVHILAISFSSIDAVYSNHVTFWPISFNLDNYTIVVRDAQFFRSYFITFVRAALGLSFGIVMTVLAAYPMSQSKFKFQARGIFVVFFMGTMLFDGGMIPKYLAVKQSGVLDTIWALILPCSLNTYFIILLMNFMKGLPDSITESAFLDGAGHFKTLTRIVLPLCKPSIATVSLFIIMLHWNSWFDGMVYITNMSLKPLQTYLRSVVIVDSTIGDSSMYLEDLIANATADGSNGAKIFLAMIPVLCFYPFFQKYFAKGIVRGSVKE